MFDEEKHWKCFTPNPEKIPNSTWHYVVPSQLKQRRLAESQHLSLATDDVLHSLHQSINQSTFFCIAPFIQWHATQGAFTWHSHGITMKHYSDRKKECRRNPSCTSPLDILFKEKVLCLMAYFQWCTRSQSGLPLLGSALMSASIQSLNQKKLKCRCENTAEDSSSLFGRTPTNPNFETFSEAFHMLIFLKKTSQEMWRNHTYVAESCDFTYFTDSFQWWGSGWPTENTEPLPAAYLYMLLVRLWCMLSWLMIVMWWWWLFLVLQNSVSSLPDWFGGKTVGCQSVPKIIQNYWVPDNPVMCLGR